MKFKYLLKGIVKCIPGVEVFYEFNRTTGGTNNVRYCYTVWLRHISLAFQMGFKTLPERIAELGPGDTLGTGLAALILGANKYYALDAKRYCSEEENLKMFDDLVILFKQKANIPGADEFPKVWPLLTDYSFPTHIYNDEFLNKMLDETRLSTLRNSIKKLYRLDTPDPNNPIEYLVHWNESADIQINSLDLVFSQSVLQHIDDLEFTYKKMAQWVKPNGLISHVIDFKSMGSSDSWDGHWKYSDFEWKIIRGRKKFYINREPYSTHIKMLKANGFQIIRNDKFFKTSECHKNGLALRFKNLTEEDLSTSSVFIIATSNLPAAALN